MMELKQVGGAMLVVASLLSPAAAAQQPSTSAASGSTASAIDVERLPLDLHRIERQLRQTSERESHEGLRLQYFVDVFGRAPRIEIFAPGEKAGNGPVPWSAPSHQDMLQIMTPKEFRTPVMDFNSFLRWLQDKVAK